MIFFPPDLESVAIQKSVKMSDCDNGRSTLKTSNFQ